MTCEVPAISDVIDLYCMKNSYSLVDVADELNLHITGIMERLVTLGGDIINFEDGVLECIWPCEKTELSLRDTLNAALNVQKEFGATRTKIGCDLINKIVIAFGELNVLFVGSDKVHYVGIGNVLNEARKGLSFCNKKELMVTKMLWDNFESKNDYYWQEYDADYVTVLSSMDSLLETKERIECISEGCKLDELESYESELGDELTKYLHPLHKRARTNQQLQKLTSLSQVVFVAVRAIDLDATSLELLHEATNLVHEIVEEFEGILTKIIYQKELTICIIFGIPGFKHKDDAVRSVLCAQRILKSLKDIEMNVSIGISAGMVFCGILGPTQRQEFCVLGMAVHTALKIVDEFIVLELVCCINTFFRTCRILGEIFTPIRRRINGIKGSKLFFKIHSEYMKKLNTMVKCIGRRKEKKLIRKALKNIQEGMTDLDNLLPLINISGKFGIGKSTMLSWAMQEGKKLGYRLTVRVNNDLFEEPNGNAWSILKQILSSRLVNNESKILEILGTTSHQYPLYLLNKQINTSFSYPDIYLSEESAREMMVELFKQCSRGHPVLIGLDNAEHTGTESWLFIQSLLVDKLACVVATFTDTFNSSVSFVHRLMKQHYLGMQLTPYGRNELGALACHVLHVEAIHKGFIDFFQEQSGGNALHLQEILMLPPMQKHFCLVPYVKVRQSTLREEFVLAEDESEVDFSTAKVCDILDPEGLWSMKIPKHILDIIKDQTTGLNPVDQMLLRKCSMLGDSFGLRILEAVCPEYTCDELYQAVQSLVEKNILTSACEHWTVVESEGKRKISLGEMSFQYCVHSVRFVSEFLKRCMLQSFAESQRTRLNLYLADLLQDETTRRCDACRKEAEDKRSISKPPDELFQHFKIPSVDMRLCHCLNLKMDVLIQMEFHLEKGKATVPKRIGVLLEAAKTGLDVRDVPKVEEILNKTKWLRNLCSNEPEPDHLKIAIERIRAILKLQLGKTDDSLRCLKHAMLLMNVVFPEDVKKGIYKSSMQKGLLAEEECSCQSLGSFILMTLGEFDDAYLVAKLHLNCLKKLNPSTCQVIEARILLLKALSKCEAGKPRGSTSRKLMNQIKKQCFQRLSEQPVLSLLELRTIIRALLTLVNILFETAELQDAAELGCKCFQLLKKINHPKQLTRFIFILANIFFYQQDKVKCLEMLNQLQDAYQQSGDSISEVIYYTMLVKLVRATEHPESDDDQVRMCNDYAENGTVAVSCHPKHNKRIFCLSATMALWCLENELEDTFPLWYGQTLKLKKDLPLNNYWTLSGSILLGIVEISKLRQKYFVFTRKEVEAFKENMQKDIENIQRQVRSYVPVLERDVREMKKCLHYAIKESQVLRD